MTITPAQLGYLLDASTGGLGGRIVGARADGGGANGRVSVDAPLPDDVEALKAMLLAKREAHRAELREQALRIEQLRQRITKLRMSGSGNRRRAVRRDAVGDRRIAGRDRLALHAPQAGPLASTRSSAARAFRLSGAQIPARAAAVPCTSSAKT